MRVEEIHLAATAKIARTDARRLVVGLNTNVVLHKWPAFIISLACSDHWDMSYISLPLDLCGSLVRFAPYDHEHRKRVDKLTLATAADQFQ